MSQPQPPKPAKLVVGLFMQDISLFTPAARALENCFGPTDMLSPWFAFDFTRYYAPEMGAPLVRRMMVFKNLIGQRSLADIKCTANGVESTFAAQDRRRVNIDPGYLLLERFVLATGKNYSHRIYIDRGIYADLTLIYRDGAFQSLPWTYPDYADARMRHFLGRVRQKYNDDLKRISRHDQEHDRLCQGRDKC
jgi:hypothetical protein